MAIEILVTTSFEQWYEALSLAEQAPIIRVVGLLGREGRYPRISVQQQRSRISLCDARVAYPACGEPYRILYALDPIRRAVLLVGGVKTGIGNRWYEAAIRDAERLWVEYLRGEKL